MREGPVGINHSQIDETSMDSAYNIDDDKNFFREFITEIQQNKKSYKILMEEVKNTQFLSQKGVHKS